MQRRIAAACVWLGACLFPSLDGLSGSDGGGDAMFDASDATVEASADAGPDVAADAIVDVVTTPFACAKVDARFCDDFDDEDAGPFAHWSSSYAGSGAYYARAPSDASPPTASQFESFGWDSSTPPYAIFEKDFVAAITSSAQLSFDLRVDTWPTSPNAYFNTADLAFGGTNGGGTNLVLRQTASALQETILTDAGKQYPSHTLTVNPVLGVWLHVELIWKFASSAITVEIRFDGKTVLAPTTLDSRLTYGVPTLRIGETYVDPTNDRESFLIDDVVFDFQ